MPTSSRILCIGSRMEAFIQTLRHNSFEVMGASSFQSAKAITHLFPPSAILIDATDPDLLRQVKFSCPKIPVLPVSSDCDERLLIDHVATVLEAHAKTAS